MIRFQEQSYLEWISNMKKNIWIILAFIFVILTFVIISILIDRHREKNVNTFEFPKTIVVNNHTENFRADTIAMIITHLILGYDTINIDIFELKQDLSNDDYEIVGFIQKSGKPHSYQIFLKKTSKQYVMRFISHELVHLDQMERGDLIPIMGNQEFIVYKGDTIVYKDIPYDKRSYEIDAFSREREIEHQLRNLLYKN